MDDPQLQRAIYASYQTARAQGYSVAGGRSSAGQSLGKEGANFASRLAGPVGAYRQLPSSYSPATRSHAVSSSNRGGGGSGGGGGLSGSSYHLHAKHGRVDSLRRDGIRPATTATVAGGEGGASSISAPSLGGSNRPLPPGRNDAAAAAVATQHSQYLRADTRRRGATFQPSSNTTRTSRTNITTAADAVALGSIGSMGPYGTTTVPHSGQNPVMEAIAAVTSSSLSAAEALVALPVGLEQSGPGGRRSAPRPPAGAHDGDGGGSGVMAAAAPIAPTAAPVGGQGPPPRQLVPVPAASGGGGGVVMVPAGVDPALAEAVLRDAVTWDTGVAFDDIAGCEAAKQLLHEAVALPLVIPEFFTGIREPWRGVLLHGPPGTGKTLLAKAVAGMVGGAFFAVSPASLTSKWRGESEKLLSTLFELARANAPAVIFMDEIDAVGSARGSEGEHEASRRFKAELLQQLDGMCSGRGVMLLAATNCPWDLDPALRRRLEKRILIGLPDAAARLALLRLHLRGVSLAADVDLATVATACEGLSGADIRLMCREAAMAPLRRQIATHDRRRVNNGTIISIPPHSDLEPAAASEPHAAQHPTSGRSAASTAPAEAPPAPPRLRSVADLRRLADSGELARGLVVTAADLAAARAALRPSVSPEQVARYIAWDQDFAST
ncbi:hypothetical protein CHLRE_10g451850v5 [Chlamydomonas reinhardtii]|uniref:AAA+ ATPase domain-containing protein n=1 Tax=Chlamydomonas reinhardtii TaxID=3055 RepID=A0A2K3DB79_CHLRE|nr:uncharacterized protein CHLRE_10g451850v5 [Chlamydomonas reinhardtii]PNW77789.1 hypothetical protein CHLRE_10g451850v5 [Chlamydomonas reinhardtii]